MAMKIEPCKILNYDDFYKAIDLSCSWLSDKQYKVPAGDEYSLSNMMSRMTKEWIDKTTRPNDIDDSKRGHYFLSYKEISNNGVSSLNIDATREDKGDADHDQFYVFFQPWSQPRGYKASHTHAVNDSITTYKADTDALVEGINLDPLKENRLSSIEFSINKSRPVALKRYENDIKMRTVCQKIVEAWLWVYYKIHYKINKLFNL